MMKISDFIWNFEDEIATCRDRLILNGIIEWYFGGSDLPKKIFWFPGSGNGSLARQSLPSIFENGQRFFAEVVQLLFCKHPDAPIGSSTLCISFKHSAIASLLFSAEKKDIAAITPCVFQTVSSSCTLFEGITVELRLSWITPAARAAQQLRLKAGEVWHLKAQLRLHQLNLGSAKSKIARLDDQLASQGGASPFTAF
jgi:hypothetical protein